jgi:hypothetical protein
VVVVALDLWERLAKELILIIGENGFHSLYLRSLYVNGPAFPWLENISLQPSDSRFSGLIACYESRRSNEVASANISLLIALADTLVSVIGESLTLGILRAAWRNYALDTVEKEFPE